MSEANLSQTPKIRSLQRDGFVATRYLQFCSWGSGVSRYRDAPRSNLRLPILSGCTVQAGYDRRRVAPLNECASRPGAIKASIDCESQFLPGDRTSGIVRPALTGKPAVLQIDGHQSFCRLMACRCQPARIPARSGAGIARNASQMLTGRRRSDHIRPG
jgi:hypothetical protein